MSGLAKWSLILRSAARATLQALWIISVLVLAILAGGCLLFFIGLDRPNAHYVTHPLALEEFYQQSGGNLPQSATNIYYASSRVGLRGFLSLRRFDAPVADCIEYSNRLVRERGGNTKADLQPIREPPTRAGVGYFKAMGLSDVTWFDIETIRSGLTCDLGPDGHGPGESFWIDTDRGRFYYWSSD